MAKQRKAVDARDRTEDGSPIVLQDLVELVKALHMAVAELLANSRQQGQPPAKQWYTTSELAAALDRSQYTVQARWCAERRIECEKDPTSDKWRIPAREYDRLIQGGSLRAKAK